VTGTDVQPEPLDGQPVADVADRPSLLKWQAQLQASPGFRAIALTDRVKRMGYLFQGNVAQYKSFVASLQDPSVSFPIMDVRSPDAHDDLLSEAERLLHNVLTAMSTRVDQQRRFMDKYFQEDSVLMTEYGERVASAFTASSEAAFLKGLRITSRIPNSRSPRASRNSDRSPSRSPSSCPVSPCSPGTAGTPA